MLSAGNNSHRIAEFNLSLYHMRLEAIERNTDFVSYGTHSKTRMILCTRINSPILCHCLIRLIRILDTSRRINTTIRTSSWGCVLWQLTSRHSSNTINLAHTTNFNFFPAVFIISLVNTLNHNIWSESGDALQFAICRQVLL